MRQSRAVEQCLLLAMATLSIITARPLASAQVRLVTLATGQLSPVGVAVSDGYVYWTNQNLWFPSVNRVPVGGGNVTVLVNATRSSDPLELAVDGGFLYWTDFHSGTVNRIPVDGGTVQVLASNQDHPRSLMVRDGYVYWAEFLEGNIKRIHSDGSGAIEEVLRGRIGVSSMAIDGNYIYWAEGAIQGADVSRIGKASLPNGTATATLFVKTVKPWSITIREGYLFWTEYRWGGVYKVPLNPGIIETISEPGLPLDDFMITSDDQNVYWTEVTSGRILASPVAGGAVTVLAANRTDPLYIASDGQHLVWTEGKAGNVMLYNLIQPGQAPNDQYLVAVGIAGFVIVVLISGIKLMLPKRLRHRASDSS